MQIKTFKHTMPVNGNCSDSMLEDMVNEFIRDKIVIDVKYTTNIYVDNTGDSYICNLVMVLYEIDNSNIHKNVAINAAVAAEYKDIGGFVAYE